MYVIIWKYRVKPGCESAFEELYRSDGDWATWFKKSPAYISTELLSSEKDVLTYITIDRWQSKEAYDAYYLQENDEFQALDRRGDALTTEELRWGAFDSRD